MFKKRKKKTRRNGERCVILPKPRNIKPCIACSVSAHTIRACLYFFFIYKWTHYTTTILLLLSETQVSAWRGVLILSKSWFSRRKQTNPLDAGVQLDRWHTFLRLSGPSKYHLQTTEIANLGVFVKIRHACCKDLIGRTLIYGKMSAFWASRLEDPYNHYLFYRFPRRHQVNKNE